MARDVPVSPEHLSPQLSLPSAPPTRFPEQIKEIKMVASIIVINVKTKAEIKVDELY